jgi:predicted TIM-barrel fold metal-dependent hydrolase
MTSFLDPSFGTSSTAPVAPLPRAAPTAVRRKSQVIIQFMMLSLPLLAGAQPQVSEPLQPDAPKLLEWRADHHMHLASAELCRLVGECLPSNDPPAVFASDAVHALDEARVAMGVILSCAYLYGLPSLHLTSNDIAAKTRRENEFTAAEVAQYPTRLVGFLSVNPLQMSAIDEIRHWSGSRVLVGLKLHFPASAVHMRDPSERRRVERVFKAAAAQHLPIVIHLGGDDFDASDTEIFIRSVLPNAGSSWVQIAHAGGGFPPDSHVRVLRTFADHIAQDDPLTRHVLFDLAYVPAPDENAAAVMSLMREVRRIGIGRFLFGSDFNVLSPRQEIENLVRLGLTRDEGNSLRRNCAPWVCQNSTARLAN